MTAIDQSRGDLSHGWPQWLPDKRSFLYFVRTSRVESTGVYQGTLGSAGVSKLIVDSHAAAKYAPPRTGRTGHLLFLRGTPCWRNLSILPVSSSTVNRLRIADPVGG